MAYLILAVIGLLALAFKACGPRNDIPNDQDEKNYLIEHFRRFNR